MTNLNLTGPQSAVLAAGLAVAGLALHAVGTRHPRSRAAAPYLFEAGVVAVLYAVWQWLASFGHARLGTAVARGETLLRWQDDLHLPSELALQRAVLPHPWLVQAANLYYAVAHFTVMGLLLAWLFIRHRRRYPPVRSVLVVVTAACLAIQFLAVAPPRLLPGAGFVDTPALYGQSVYGSLTSDDVRTLGGVDFGADQLSAMPSVHVAWALLVALAVQWASTSRWRVLVWLHPVVTVLVIVVTANHYWADGIVAAVLLALAVLLVRSTRRVWRRHRTAAAARPAPEASDRLDGGGVVEGVTPVG
ncbi:phosphatase PAP2 family protein [Jatrophihabitans sp. YIM 134969]